MTLRRTLTVAGALAFPLAPTNTLQAAPRPAPKPATSLFAEAPAAMDHSSQLPLADSTAWLGTLTSDVAVNLLATMLTAAFLWLIKLIFTPAHQKPRSSPRWGSRATAARGAINGSWLRKDSFVPRHTTARSPWIITRGGPRDFYQPKCPIEHRR